MATTTLSDAIQAYLLGKAGKSWQEYSGNRQMMELRKQQEERQQEVLDLQKEETGYRRQERLRQAEEEAARKQAAQQFIESAPVESDYRQYAAMALAQGKLPPSFDEYTRQSRIDKQREQAQALEASQKAAQTQGMVDAISRLPIPDEYKQAFIAKANTGQAIDMTDLMRFQEKGQAAFTPVQRANANKEALKSLVLQEFSSQETKLKEDFEVAKRVYETTAKAQYNTPLGMQTISPESVKAAEAAYTRAAAALSAFEKKRNTALAGVDETAANLEIMASVQPDQLRGMAADINRRSLSPEEYASRQTSVLKNEYTNKAVAAGMTTQQINGVKVRIAQQAAKTSAIRGIPVGMAEKELWASAVKTFGTVAASEDAIMQAAEVGKVEGSREASMTTTQEAAPPPVEVNQRGLMKHEPGRLLPKQYSDIYGPVMQHLGDINERGWYQKFFGPQNQKGNQ